MSSRFPPPLRGRRSVALAGAVSASLLLVACGGSGTSTNSTAAAEKNRERKFLVFAKCLREHGINVQTPTGAGGLKVGLNGVGAPQRMEAARKACKKYAPFDRPNLTPQQRVEQEEAVQKFAKCMREHGIKIETKTGGGGEIGIHVGSGEKGPNPESPAFRAAQKACESLLPRPPGGAGPGGPGGQSTSKRGAGPGGGSKLGFQVGG
jgi:hypothetical protein